MPRAVSNVPRLKRKKQIMKAARGAVGARSKLWRPAKEPVEPLISRIVESGCAAIDSRPMVVPASGAATPRAPSTRL